MSTLAINFSKLSGLVPCVVQDAKTQCVLMLGFMNEEAYQKTIAEKRVTFFSRSKQRLWTKGETSGNFLDVVDILLDCDQDTLLIKANPIGGVCHTGADTCFNEDNNRWDLTSLENIIKDRKTIRKKVLTLLVYSNRVLIKWRKKLGKKQSNLLSKRKMIIKNCF